MPSTSKAQQRFMGLVHAYKKGEVKGSEVSKAIKKAAKSMKKSSTKKYASTKHTDLPDKVKQEGFGGQLKGKDKLKFEKARKANGEQLGYKLSGTPDVKEDRDYKEEYKKYGSSTKSKKYRAELNQYNRKKGTYGNGDGKDASHKGGKIVGFEKESTNRGRAEKSRLKKESSSEYGKSIEKIANDRKLKSISKKDRGMLLKIAKLMKKANEGKGAAIYISTFEKLLKRQMGSKFSKSAPTEKDIRQVLGLMRKRYGELESVHKESINEKTVSIGGEELLKFLMKRFKMSKSQAIASMKKHKMDMSFLKKESVNESIQLPHGMELGKVFTGHGKSFVKEAVEPAGNIKKVLDVAKNQQSKKIGGTLVDLTTANLMTQVWNKVNDSSKEKMNKMNAKQLTNLILRIWKGVGTPRV